MNPQLNSEWMTKISDAQRNPLKTGEVLFTSAGALSGFKSLAHLTLEFAQEKPAATRAFEFANGLQKALQTVATRGFRSVLLTATFHRVHLSRFFLTSFFNLVFSRWFCFSLIGNNSFYFCCSSTKTKSILCWFVDWTSFSQRCLQARSSPKSIF